MNHFIERAEAKYEKAAKALIAEIHRQFPKGSLLTVRKGRGEFDVKVIHISDSWWSNPGTFRGMNIVTGGVQNFSNTNVIKLVRRARDQPLNP